METQTVILTTNQINQKIKRLAFQIYEDNVAEKEIIIAGIVQQGYRLAEKISIALREISPLQVKLISIDIDKQSQISRDIKLPLSSEELNNKVVVVVDDVLNSGKTLMYAIRPFLEADIRKLRTVVLVDRNHKRYAVSADFVGLSMSTTLQEHVSVVIDAEQEGVYIS